MPSRRVRWNAPPRGASEQYLFMMKFWSQSTVEAVWPQTLWIFGICRRVRWKVPHCKILVLESGISGSILGAFWGPQELFLGSLGPPDVLIIRAGGGAGACHAMCIQCLCCPFSSVSESLSAANPFNRRIGASVIMSCVESMFVCIPWWLHPRNWEQPYEHNWIWNLQTLPKNLRLSEGPQNHDKS